MGPSLDEVLAKASINKALIEDPRHFSFPEAPHLIVTLEEWFPHVKLAVDPSGNFTASGPMLELLDLLAKSLNFKYSLVRPPDGAWGVTHGDGKFNGMVGQIQRKEVDIALGPFGVSEPRSKAADYTVPILVDYYTLLVQKAQPEVNPFGFLLPFDPMVWVGIMISFAVVLALLPLVTWALRSNLPHQWTRRLSNATFYTNVVFENIRVFCQQNLQMHLSMNSTRFLMAVWMLMVLVLLRSYNGALTSILAVRNIPIKIDTLRQLVDEPSFFVIIEASAVFMQHIMGSKQGIYADLMGTKQEGRMIEMTTTEMNIDGLERVRHGQHAFVLEELTLKTLMSQDFSKGGACHFYMIREKFMPFFFAMIGRKGSPLVPAISRRVFLVSWESESSFRLHFLSSKSAGSQLCRPFCKSCSTDD
ncbi:glutamate receptor ionotropic, delta-2-like isoform X2 [Oratosquilla oratoria]|uniref:glutamate receptor ionotropic, delta-2-like isoform X2 n=1 Tax=Oratosquilla oratoria TaxID=337810 RepID=UPI003F75849A